MLFFDFGLLPIFNILSFGMKRVLLLVICVLAFYNSRATHIVGGEFEMLYKGTAPNGYHLYTISLILYFDAKNGLPTAKDGQVNIRIFRKRDNSIMNSLTLDSVPSTVVQYYQPECSSGIALKTYRMYYTYMGGGNVQATLALSPNEYADPKGYYLAWERCCRNYSITNIWSQDPNQGGIYAGQTFYLEFPPMQKNGLPFINSSPTLFPPLSDYACPGSLYYVDFSGTDPDGDSLVYSLVDPLNTKSGDALPPPAPPGLPRPGPYPTVDWRSPFGINNIMAGNPDLKISIDGLLTVVPKLQGLYVFSVRCEEYRSKIKIGEVRRDFQLLVLAECKKAAPPKVEAKPKGDPGPFKSGSLNVTYNSTVSDADRCVDIRVTDPDSGNDNDGDVEDVKIRAIPLGFKDNISSIIPTISSAKLVGADASIIFTVCFPACPYPEHAVGPYKIGIIAQDNACPLPKLDTVIITVNVTPPPNHWPEFQESLVDQTVVEGTTAYSHNIIGTDADNDKLTLTMLPISFDLEQYGFSFTDVQPVPDGQAKGVLTWNTKCDQIDFSKLRNFEIKFLLEDGDHCLITSPDTMTFKLDIDLIDVHNPDIQYEPLPTMDTVIVSRKIFETLNFNVLGLNQDNDLLSLTGNGVDFNAADYGVSFASKNGKPLLSSPFFWPIDCDKVNLSQKSEFDFRFIVVDNHNRCGYYLADTLYVNVLVNPPDNTPPTIKVNGHTDEQTLMFKVGDPISINVSGNDIDIAPTDLLTLSLIDATGNNAPPNGFTFQSTPARANVTGLLSWLPSCDIYKGLHYDQEPYQNDYTFSFKVSEDRCHDIKEATAVVNVKVRDEDAEKENFIPPNFITPNGDGLNDFFAMVAEDPNTKELVSILPKDNCKGRFVGIHIYNRWGKEVYSSENRDFRWYADNLSVGVYFYSLVFSDREYKGTVTIRL
jgi:hypothetical protein